MTRNEKTAMIADIYSRYKNYAANLGTYLCASLITMTVTMAVNPWIALNMSPTDYAIVGYYTSFNLLLTPLINFYLINFYTKRYYELSPHQRKELKATTFKFLIYFSSLITCVCVAALWGYTKLFNSGSELPFAPYAFLALFQLTITGIYSLQLAEYKIEGNSRSFFSLSVSNGVLTALLSLLFVVLLKWGAGGKLLAPFTAGLALFVYCLVANRNLFRIPFNWDICRKMTRFCLPLVLAAMLNFFSNGYDRTLLEKTGNLYALGIYVVAFQMASFIYVFQDSINSTFLPDIFKSIVARRFRSFAKIVAVKALIISGIVVVFILCAPLVIRILTAGRYMEATHYARILSIASITSVLYYSVSQGTIALGLTRIPLYNKIFGSVVNITMFYFLVKHYGARGASWGVVISYLIFTAGNIIFLWFNRKRFSKSEEADDRKQPIHDTV